MFGKVVSYKKLAVVLLLLGVAWCIPPLNAASDTGAAGQQRIEDLRQRQQEDLARLKSYYDDLARKLCPRLENGQIDTSSSEYQNLEKDYRQDHEKLRKAYLKKDPRLTDFQPGNEISGIKSSGSRPKDVRADVDWTAETPEALAAKRRQWEQRGDVIVDHGHKIVNETTDETLWKPGSEPGSDALVHDGDAHGTQGGREAVTRKKSPEGHDISGDGIRDAEGAALDHEKKYLDAKERNNLKDQAKTAVKSADDIGRKSDVVDQARELKNYGDEITSGISHLGEDPDQRADKVKEFQKKLDSEMDASTAEGRKKGQQTDSLRKKIADSARKAENSGDAAWDAARKNANYGDQDTTSAAIENRRNDVAESNQRTREEIARRKAGTDPDRPDADTAEAAKKTQTSDTPDTKRKTPPEPPALIKKTISDPDGVTDSTGKKQAAADDAARTRDNSGSQDAAGATPARSKTGQAADGFNTADDLIQAIETGTTYVEGIQEGDAGKAISPVVGQDTAKRVKMENAREWADLEGQADEAKKTEVSSELEAKLRRMGASAQEARDARDKWDKGDVKGFREDVAKIKARGQKDPAPRGLAPDGPIEDEDGALDRLKEGGKQAGRYVDSFYGGINERTQQSVEKRDELNNVQEEIQDGIQDEIDNALIKKMMRKGVPYKKARDALEQKRSGDARAWNQLRDSLPGRGDPSARHDGDGLSADGKTQSYETSELTEDWKDNALKEAEQKGNTILKPFDMIAEWKEANHLEEMRDNQRAAEFYKAMRKWGAGKEEALEAARAFAETGDRSKSGKIYQKYKKENLEKREAADHPNEKKDAAGNWVCKNGYHRVNGKCVPEPEPECRSDAQCPAGYVCRQGKCMSPFDSGYDDYEKTLAQRTGDRDQDRADQIAADQSSAPKPKGYTSKDLSSDLDTAQNDLDGRCQSDSQCPPGYVCSNGSCVDPFQSGPPADPGAAPSPAPGGDPAGDPMHPPDPAAAPGTDPDPAAPPPSTPSLAVNASVIDEKTDSIQYAVAASVTGISQPVSLTLSLQNAATGGSTKTLTADGTATWAVTVLDKNATATVRRSDTGASQSISLPGKKPVAQPPPAPSPDPPAQAPAANYDGIYKGWAKYVCVRNGKESSRGTLEGYVLVRGNKIVDGDIEGTISGSKISGKDLDSGFTFTGDINYKRAYGTVSGSFLGAPCRGTFEFTRQ
jgi:Cys-rich repeat protein